MKQQLHAILLLLLVSEVALAQNDTYSIFLDKNNKFSSINSREFFQGRKNEKRKLKIRVAINANDSLIKAYYQPYLEKHINLLGNIEESRKELKEYYALSDAEISEIKKESQCHIALFPNELKEYFGYKNLTLSGVGCPSRPTFNPYTIEVVAFPRNADLPNITAKSSTAVLENDWLNYKLQLETHTMSIDRINYRIKFNKPEAQHFNNSIDSYPSITEYKSALSNLKKAGEILKDVNRIVTVSSQTADINLFESELNDYLNSLGILDSKISGYFNSYRGIVKKWLWYTGGKPSLNPFYRASEQSKIQEISAQISSLRRDSLNASISMSGSEAKYEFYKETVKSNIKDKLQLAEMSVTILPKSVELVDIISAFNLKRLIASNAIDSLSSVLKELKEKEKQLKITETEFRKKDIFWYDGFAFPGDVKTFNGRVKRVNYRNYNRLKHLELYQRLPSSYDESTEVYILIENESKDNIFSEYLKDVADEAPLSASLGDALGQLSNAGLISAINSIGNKSIDSDVEEGSPVEYMLATIAEIGLKIEYYDKNILPPPNIPKAFEPDLTSQYRTDYYLAKLSDTNKSSYIYNQVVVQDKQRDTLKFRITKLYHILPSVGLVYTTAKRPEVLLNADGTIKTVKYFNGSSLMIGLKFHPFATPIYDPKFVISGGRRPDFDYRKIHFMAGVNAFRPLQEYYVGLGLDLWSGFSFSSGFHLINKTQQKLVDQRLQSKKYLDGRNFYFGVNVDVSVAIKLINILSR